MGITFIKNVANSPTHLAFSVVVIAVISVLVLIAFAKTNKHKGLNEKFIPSGHTTLGFAANTIIWISTCNPVILILSLTMAMLLASSRVQAKEQKLSEVIFSAWFGTILLLGFDAISAGVLRLF